MRMARYGLGLALLVVTSLCLLPALQAAGEPAPDSAEVTSLLAQAKTYSLRLTRDAEMMQTFANPRISWESHAGEINVIRGHINNLGKVLQQLNDAHSSASPWQRAAIDHIMPLARELASDIESTIDHINKNQTRLYTPVYRDYLKANYQVSSNLSRLISDYLAYGQSRAKYERLGSKLEAPGH